jgi:hypothetical protein
MRGGVCESCSVSGYMLRPAFEVLTQTTPRAPGRGGWGVWHFEALLVLQQ